MEDQRSGAGVYTYPNGDTFDGAWASNKREGKGVYTYAATGVTYEGLWSEGLKNGQGTIAYDNHTYEGNFTDDQPLGEGKYAFASGAEQDGKFVPGVPAEEEEEAATAPTWAGERISMSE